MILQSILSGQKQEIIKHAVRETRHIHGALAELGVYQGGTAQIISDGAPEKPIHLFDTFTGIPEKSEKDWHNIGDFGGPNLNAIKEALKGRDVTFHIGTFPATLLQMPQRNIAYSFVHLDADQYNVTLTGLNYFFPLLSKGGIIILDDYEWQNCPGVKIAIDEFLGSLGEKERGSVVGRGVGNQFIIKKELWL